MALTLDDSSSESRAQLILLRVERIAAQAAVLSALVMMLAVTAQVVAGQVFDLTIPGLFEIVELTMVAVVYLGLSYTQYTGQHVRIDILLERFPKNLQDGCEIVTTTLMLGIVVLITWQSAIIAYSAWETGSATRGLIEFPLWPARVCVPIGMSILAVRLFVQLLLHLQNFRNEPLKQL